MPYAANAGESPLVGGGTVMSDSCAERPGTVDRWPHGTFLAELAGSPEAAKTLLSLGTPRSYGAGEHLLMEGLRETFVLLLLNGVTKVTATTEDGETALLAIRLGGDLVGEFAAFDNRPRSATVTSAGAVTARRIGQRDFLDCLDGYPAAALAVSRMLVRKNRWSVRRRGDFSGCPVAIRVARVLVDLVEDYGESRPGGVLIGPRLTQAELAGLVGARERRVHHVLGELAGQGVIQVGYGRTSVLSPAGLRRAARLMEPD
jgi:CRP/FNR family transcriptional regulator, cyclic AMP receptor protein